MKTTTNPNFCSILAFKAGYGSELFPRVLAEFINLEHVSHFNRHSNLINMSSGLWFQLHESEMIKFLEEFSAWSEKRHG
jgi:hypothetical protein